VKSKLYNFRGLTMISKKASKIITFILAFLFPLTSVLVPISGAQQPSGYNLTALGVGSYFEDFVDTTFQSPATNAQGWGTGTVSNRRDFPVEFLDYYNTSKPVYGVDVQGRKAYLGCFGLSSPETLIALDISNIRDVQYTSHRDTSGGIIGIAVEGDACYTIINDTLSINDRVNIYNISDPYNLGAGAVYMGSVYNDMAPTDIAIEGHQIYMTSYGSPSSHSLWIADVQDPSAAYNLSNSYMSDQALGLDVSYPYVYLANAGDGFSIIDVRDKDAVTVVGSVDTPGIATDVLIDGNLAFVADGPGGVQIIDISDYAAPQIIGSYDTPGLARRLEKQGNTLYVADGPTGVQVLDVANPTQPLFVTGIVTAYAWDIDMYGGDIVIGTDNGVYFYRLGVMLDFSNTAYDNPFNQYQVWDVRVRGDIAYVAGGPDGFYTLNVRNPMAPVLLDWVNITYSYEIYRKLDVQGNYAYVVDAFGVYVFDISDPTNIVQVNFLLSNNLTDIFLHGEVAYIAWGLGGCAIMNISDPMNFDWPDELSEPYFGTNTTAVWVQGYHGYFADWTGGLGDSYYTVDVADLTNPELINTEVRNNCYQWDTIVEGDIACIAAGNWLSFYNVSDPYNPIFINDVNYGTGTIDCYGCWFFGPYVIGVGPQGAHLVNATNFSSYEGTNYAAATGGLQVTTHGDYTYVANKTSLIILRHHASAGASYIPGFSVALSEIIYTSKKPITSAILNAVDFVPMDTHIDYYMSVNGFNWELVTPGVEHVFVNIGTELIWRAQITGPQERSAYLYELSIDYTYEGGLSGNTLWILLGVGGGILVLIIIVVVIVTITRKKKIPTR
jgi:hypothetical protein